MRLVLTVVLCALSLTIEPAQITAEPLLAHGPKAKFKAGRVMARYKQPLTPAQHARLTGAGWVQRKNFNLVPGLVLLERHPGQNGAAVDNPDVGEMLEQIAELHAMGMFAYVEPDYEVRAFLEPNDSRFSDGTLWGLRNTGQAGGLLGADIDVQSAWDLTTGSTNVIVAVIDTGIRYTHQDLATQMWRNPGELPGNGRDDDADGYIDNVFGINAITGSGDPADDHGHGTHVAGTIGAAANNGHPHVGVAWNVRLMACKFLDRNGGGATSDAVECIDFAVSKGAHILNNSWGGTDFSQGLLDAIARARSKGVLFVAASGNDRRDNDRVPAYPASHQIENMVAVTAVDRSDVMAEFANYGRNSVQIGAPGVAIFSSAAASDSDYQTYSGTSMAAPHVAGAAALILARYPRISMTEVRQRLLQSAFSIGALDGKTQTGGRLNVRKALDLKPDNQLEIGMTTLFGYSLPAGGTIPLLVTVTDLQPITNAVVTGTLQTPGDLQFTNNGREPDETANDTIYTSMLSVPTNVTAFTVTVMASAPGKTATTNRVTFGIVAPPPNDSFANRILINPESGPVSGSNRNATRETGEPRHARLGGGRSVWWSWTAPATGIATFSTAGSSFDTVMALYGGTSMSRLSIRGSNDDVHFGTPTSEIIRAVNAGITYHIAVDGFLGATGDIVLSAGMNSPLDNDMFAGRTSLSGIDISVAGSNFGANRETEEPGHSDAPGGGSVWWSWTAPQSGPVIISTAGSTFDTMLAVYTGSSLNALTRVLRNDDVIPRIINTSEVRFNAQQGRAYQIAVDGYRGETGNITLSIVAPPENNEFGRRFRLTGAFAESKGHNFGANKETGEPEHADDRGGQSVWWTWAATADGYATVTTAGSNFDTMLGVYTGSSVRTLKRISSNDDIERFVIRQSQLTFPARAGTEYHLAVDGFNIATVSDSGLISLTVVLDATSRIGIPERLRDGRLKLRLSGEPNRTYVLQRSPDLHQWLPISTNTLIGKSFIFIDHSVDPTVRFYRAFPASLISTP